MLKRRRVRRHTGITIAGLWKKFKVQYPDLAEEIGNVKNFTKIIHTGNELTKDYVLEDPLGFRLPERLGKLFISKYKSDIKITDRVKSKEYKTKVYYQNSHSDGYTYRIYWAKEKGAVSNISAFVFKGSRRMKRGLAQRIKQRTHDYFEK